MIIENLKADFIRISKYFHGNFIVRNPDKCHFTVLGEPKYIWNLPCNGRRIKYSKEEKVLGVTIDDKGTFSLHLGKIRKRTKIFMAINSKTLHRL